MTFGLWPVLSDEVYIALGKGAFRADCRDGRSRLRQPPARRPGVMPEGAPQAGGIDGRSPG